MSKVVIAVVDCFVLKQVDFTVIDIPSLIDINNKHNIVPETCQTMTGWHGDDKGKYIIYKSVERLKHENDKVTALH